MKKLVLGSLIAVNGLLASGNIVAVVNGEKITKAEINEVLAQKHITYEQIPVQVRKKILDEIITQALLIQKAKKSGIENSPEFKKELKKLKDQLAFRLFLKNKMDSMKISEKELKAFYNKNKDLMFKEPAQVKARHILVKSKAEAEKIISELRKVPKSKLEQKFIELAKKNSVGPSGKMGGELGWFSKNRMIPAFSKVAFKLNKDEISLQPVHTRFGWHIIYVEDKKEGGYIPFEKVKNRIAQYLKMQELKKYIDRLKKKANIRYYN